MKKLIMYAIVLALVVSLTACSQQPDADGGTSSTPSVTDGTTETTSSSEISNDKSSTIVENSNKTSTRLHSTQKVSTTKKDTTTTKESFSTGKGTSSTSKTMSTTKTTSTKRSSTKSSATPHTHTYSKSVKAATCDAEGYTLYKCACGSQYKENVTPVTHAHTFVRGERRVGDCYFDGTYCSRCDILVFSYGNADGSIVGGNDKVKYYVTGRVSQGEYGLVESDFHIVIYGQGAMPSCYEEIEGRQVFNPPAWHDYLYYAKKITIAEGITSISKGSFYYTDIAKDVEFDMADSVKTIESNSIYLKGGSLTLGAGVEWVGGISGSLKSVYLPKSVKFFGAWDNRVETVYFYAGSKAEFLAIETWTTNKGFTVTVTVKEFLEKYFSNDYVYSPRMHVYLNAQNVDDRSQYFNTMNEFTNK